jgi:hypothetical protein
MSYNLFVTTIQPAQKGTTSEGRHREADAKEIGDSSRRRGILLRRAGALAAALMGLALIATACSSGSASPGVASLNAPTTTTGSSSGGSPKASALAYSACMRSHGVKDFPDPTNGKITIQGGQGSDLDPSNPTFKAAQQACQSLQPKPSAAQQHQFQQAALKYSQCMRAHGIKDFPDPTGGGLRIQAHSGSDLDPHNPTFQAAQNACQHDLPGANGGGKIGGGSTSVNGGGPGSSGTSGSGSSGLIG